MILIHCCLDVWAVFDPCNIRPANGLVGYADEQIRVLTNSFGQRAIEHLGFVTKDLTGG